MRLWVSRPPGSAQLASMSLALRRGAMAGAGWGQGTAVPWRALFSASHRVPTRRSGVGREHHGAPFPWPPCPVAGRVCRFVPQKVPGFTRSFRWRRLTELPCMGPETGHSLAGGRAASEAGPSVGRRLPWQCHCQGLGPRCFFKSLGRTSLPGTVASGPLSG